jgi:hypothetical protein
METRLFPARTRARRFQGCKRVGDFSQQTLENMMKKILAGLVLSVFAGTSFAQSVISFDVVFDTVYEASGQFAPNLGAVQPGPFNGNAAIAPPSLTAHVILSAVPSGTQLTNAGGALNQITLNGSFSTESGYSPSSGWSTHTFNNATFDLYKPNSFFATDFVFSGNDWPIFTATAANGALSDQGPASIYGGTCPFFFNCSSAQSAGTGTGTTPYGLFAPGTQIFNGTSATFPTLANAGSYAQIGGSYSQSNPGSGLGFENGIDAFAFQGVLDVLNTQGNGASQPYPDGVNGFPGKVRFLTFSTTGNTAYMVEGRVVANVVPVPAAVWLFGSALGLLGVARRRAAA